MIPSDSRPWPLPSNRPWVISMEWRNLLFAHWPVEAEAIRNLIPKGLELELFDGKAWIGIVPFEMTGVRPRVCPRVSYFSDFPELHVRTYVTKDGKPGVWFFSLDAGSKFAVRVARATFNLPYFDADFEIKKEQNGIIYCSNRTHRDSPEAIMEVSYSPCGEIFRSSPGSFEHWLTARYCLYTANKGGQIFRGEIHHKPWPLQAAKAEFKTCDMTRICGIELKDKPVNLLYSDYLEVKAWALESLAHSRQAPI